MGIAHKAAESGFHHRLHVQQSSLNTCKRCERGGGAFAPPYPPKSTTVKDKTPCPNVSFGGSTVL